MVAIKISVIVCLLICGEGVISQDLPAQVQQFLQQSFFKIREKIHDGVQEIADALAPPSHNSSTNKTLPTSTTPAAIQNDLKSTSESVSEGNNNENYSTYLPTTENPSSSFDFESSNSSEPDGFSTAASVLPIEPSENSTLNKTSRVLKNDTYFLTSDSVQELKALCPHLKDIPDEGLVRTWRYHAPSGNCSKLGNKGPCGLGMILYIQEVGSINGSCECRSSKRISIYHEATNACYGIFTQGYCAEGEWLDLTREGEPVCKVNPCFTPGKDLVRVKGQCAEVNKPSEVCEGDRQLVTFVANKRLPECRILTLGAISADIPPCRPGNSLSIHGKCHVSEWDFGDDGTGEDDKNSKN